MAEPLEDKPERPRIILAWSGLVIDPKKWPEGFPAHMLEGEDAIHLAVYPTLTGKAAVDFVTAPLPELGRNDWHEAQAEIHNKAKRIEQLERTIAALKNPDRCPNCHLAYTDKEGA